MDGTQFGHYRLLELLGRGGMGEVYRAHDTETDRVVALKLLPVGLAHDAAYQARFRREAHAAAQLNDPHIIPIHRYGEIDGRLYLDMRLVEGRDLGELLANMGGPLDPAQAVALIRQVATALDAAHRAGLVHRDVKPSNVLVTPTGFAYLIDFGIARGMEQTAMTGTGGAVGTLAYMAPERFRAGQSDQRADSYALACLLYECLTGAKAFPGDSAEHLISSHLFAPIPRPTALNPRLPPAFDHVIAVGLAKDPAQRYQTAGALADAAERALHPPVAGPAPLPEPPVLYAPQPETRFAPITPPPFHSAPTQFRAAPSSRGRRRSVVWAAASTAVVLLSVVALVIWQLWPEPTGRDDDSGSRADAPSPAAGSIVIGVKFDQPGLGLRESDGTLTGFDVDVATYLAKQLGYSADQIEWREAPSTQRETMIQRGNAEFVVATYSITTARKQQVDFAGPYLVSGQGLLVQAANTDITGFASLGGAKRLCSVSGSTPAQRVKEKFPGVQLQQYDSYSQCIEALAAGAIDAITSDEVILAGYAAQQPGVFKFVGEPISEERYGIGLKLGESSLRSALNDALLKMEQDGAWAEAFEQNFGPAGLATPAPPPIDP